jgi:hypothetical protein
MEPEEVIRQYRRSVARAAALTMPFLCLAVVPALVALFILPEKSPPGWFLLGMASSLAMVLIIMIAFIFLRRCPLCGCRSPVIRGSGGCCRRCGARLHA